ncbi:hypothetical protein Pla175_31840 [Pirellulimonas nuda]|uniref:Uncharacterized protein n=1 Tax=Pirellulimonas nuda TaxID=2528009 RepID=A0A518DE88_9BACT|nr:hypothetical protein [Pirellulimonas nuda]QDU89789.1 hypothetical protein Pla175_31840 [Pirellulimonas nuda]
MVQDASPDQAPVGSGTRNPTPGRALIDTLLLAINFVTALLILAASASAIAAGDDPYAFVSAVLTVPPVGAYAVAEWLCWYRQRSGLKRLLGVCNLLLAALMLFGLVSGLGEVYVSPEPIDRGLVAFLVLVFGATNVYLGACGWRRVRVSTPHSTNLGSASDADET